MLKVAPQARRELPAVSADGRRPLWLALIGLALAQALMAGLLALGVRNAFVALHAGDALPWGALALIAGMGLGIALTRWAEQLCAESLSQRYVLALRQRLFAHIARLSDETLTWLRRGHLQQRLAGDMGAVRVWVGKGQAHGLSALVTLPIVCALLAVWMAPALVVGVLLSVLAGLLLMVVIARDLPRGQGQLRRAQGRLHAFMGERVPHAQSLRLAGRINRESDALARLGNRLRTTAMRHQRRAAAMRAMPDLVRGVAAAWVLGAAFLVGAPPADAAATLAAVGLLMPALRDLAGFWERRTAWRRARVRLLALLARPTVPALGRAAEIPADAGALMVWHAEGPLAWHFELLRHSRVVLSGASGTGKSRLLRALAGLGAPPGGQMVRGPAARSRLRITWLGARVPLLMGSLRRALTLGCRQRPGDDKIISVATAFGLQGLLQRLGGLDARLAEDGANLSDTERRRLVLARAALSGADLVLIDELDRLLDDTTRAAWQDWLCSTEATVVYASDDPDLQRLADARWELLEEGGSSGPMVLRSAQTIRHAGGDRLSTPR
ncbi:ABC transporter ATP-binding protein [Hydrogenophaga sp.]|uniref:ATP-binding cassette domain-containing protein n=1 Tax=Hydrogenophaga sp. TaxID=1904254 RepID=UPI0026340AF5|nr:ABC transporter ATP-binding protein [Hydrogenophaga sp.]MDM7948377.1 ABC transporter ATP-binding protein [Hydrogenophaga sp.]